MRKVEESSHDGEAGQRQFVEAIPDDSDGNVCFSNVDERRWHARRGSNDGEELTRADCHDAADLEYRGGDTSSGAAKTSQNSSPMESSPERDLERGNSPIKLSPEMFSRTCRICYLGIDCACPESSALIVLGCSCKDDLASAHRHCAETWFKIKGNKTCEICGSTVKNVVGSSEMELIEQRCETSNRTVVPAPPRQPRQERRLFWHGHRFLNFLLASIVFVFIFSWLFHFNSHG